MAVRNRYYSLLLKLWKQRFFRFLVVGAIGTLIDFVLFFGLHFGLAVGIIYANTLSYGTGIISSFFLNRTFTFADSSKKSTKRVFLSVTLGYIGLLLNTVTVYFISQFIGVIYAKLLAVFIILIYNYYTNKHLVFRIK